MDYRLLGARVQRARRINGLTQERLAEMAGISLSFMGHIERGTRKASVETLVALARALGMSTDALLLSAPKRHAERGKARGICAHAAGTGRADVREAPAESLYRILKPSVEKHYRPPFADEALTFNLLIVIITAIHKGLRRNSFHRARKRQRAALRLKGRQAAAAANGHLRREEAPFFPGLAQEMARRRPPLRAIEWVFRANARGINQGGTANGIFSSLRVKGAFFIQR